MSHDDEQLPGEKFEKTLDLLRMKIDTLPQSKRPHLYIMANRIKQEHRRIEDLERQFNVVD